LPVLSSFATSYKRIANEMDVDEEELPPMLVDVEADDHTIEDIAPIKVPITIVTGKSLKFVRDTSNSSYNRISWSWKDDIT